MDSTNNRQIAPDKKHVILYSALFSCVKNYKKRIRLKTNCFYD